MVEPEAVAALLRLRALGWGSKRIARELEISRGTVKRYIEVGGWQPFRKPVRKRVLDDLDDWLRERFRRHRGNADVVRQELAAEKGIVASLRTVQRAVEPYRQELVAEARATVRFETAPGRQLQIDFGCHPTRASSRGDPEDTPGRDRRTQGEGVFLRRNARLFAPAARAGISQRAAGELVRRHGERVLGLRWRSGGGAFRQSAGSGHGARCRESDCRLQHQAPGLRPSLGLPAESLRAVPGADQGQDGAPPHASRLAWGPQGMASATSNGTPLPDAALPAGKRSRRIWRPGSVTSPTPGCTARPVRRRWSASRGTRQRRCSH